MAAPPPYQESTHGRLGGTSKNTEVMQRFSIRDEVSMSRSQHVAALVSKLLPQIRDRARRGLSRTSLLLLPSGQESALGGELVGFPENEKPVMVLLEGAHDSLEFWTQATAVAILREQLWAALSDGTPVPDEPVSLLKTEPRPAAKHSIFGRRQNKTPETIVQPAVRPPPPVQVNAQLDEVYFRTENEFGLYESLRARGVAVTVTVS